MYIPNGYEEITNQAVTKYFKAEEVIEKRYLILSFY